jgi:hypothetical protein
MDTLDIAFAEARRYLASLDTRPVASRGSPADMLAGLPARLPLQGMAATDVVRAIAAAAEPGLGPAASATLSFSTGTNHEGWLRSRNIGGSCLRAGTILPMESFTLLSTPPAATRASTEASARFSVSRHLLAPVSVLRRPEAPDAGAGGGPS